MFFDKISRIISREINSTIGKVNLFSLTLVILWIGGTSFMFEYESSSVLLKFNEIGFPEAFAAVFVFGISIHYTTKYEQ